MKFLSEQQQGIGLLLFSIQIALRNTLLHVNAANPISTEMRLIQSRLVDRCCEVGKERAIDDPKFQCKMSAREALVTGSGGIRLAAESLLSREPTFAEQCELVLESCCISYHRNRNCDSGKQMAKSGAACMDVELSKEATMATESFNDCCMSCSLGILAARSPGQNETSLINNSNNSGRHLANRCKLISSLADSLSGQLYEQTYVECCHENLPRPSGALLEPGALIDCSQSNPCAQRCVSPTSSDGGSRSRDRCDCFSGYRLSSDGVNCLDIDECKLGLHTCNRRSEVCDNTRGGFRCLARNNNNAGRLMQDDIAVDQRYRLGDDHSLENQVNGAAATASSDTSFLSIGRSLCPLGFKWAECARESVRAERLAAAAKTAARTQNIGRASSRESSLLLV